MAATDLGPRPRRAVAVLTCMDARLDPLALLGLELGDAHVVRNAGGLVTEDAVRSLSASQRLLQTTAVRLVMHDECGLCGASDAEFRALLEADGAQPGFELGAFTDVEAAVRAGVATLRERLELPHRDDVRGLVFTPSTGGLREVPS